MKTQTKMKFYLQQQIFLKWIIKYNLYVFKLKINLNLGLKSTTKQKPLPPLANRSSLHQIFI